LKNSDLFSGIAIVIDDEINTKNANINNLISQIEKRNMPYKKYLALPSADIVEHFEGISFLLLDWQLSPKTISDLTLEGVKMPSTGAEAAIEENITFLKQIRDICFTPVFIFTNADVKDVKETLITAGLYKDNRPNHIFIKSKKDLIGRNKLFNTINDWIKKTPSIYVLKAWEKEYKKSINKLFHDFYAMSPNWPRVLWKTFSDDGINMSLELGEVISRNLCSRMMPFAFDDEILGKLRKKTPKDEIRKVLSGECFISENGLHKDVITAGDIFKISNETYINVRPDCDCILNRGIANNVNDDIDLYLLRGTKFTNNQEIRKFRKKYGNFEEIDNESIVFNILNGKTFKFAFKELTIKKWSEIKEKRIGRLLPPYITRMQQRYALYMQRQGLPRIPTTAVLGD
jgi:hypothetical protein